MSFSQALHRTEPQLTASENNSPLSWTLAFIPLKEFSRSFFATLLRRMELRMDSKEFFHTSRMPSAPLSNAGECLGPENF